MTIPHARKASLLALALAASPLPAVAAPTGSIGVGVGAVPDYEGADDQQLIPFVSGRVALGERYLALEGVAVRANVLDSARWEAGPVLSYTFGRDEDVESRPVALLGEVDGAVEAGAFIARRFPLAGGAVRLAAQAVNDVSGAHNGVLAGLSAGYQAAPIGRLSLGVEVQSTYAGADYARTYFSISPAGGAASGLGAFEADGGIKDVGVSLTAGYALTPQWSLVSYVGYKRLLGDFADSPIVADEGDPNQVSVGLGVARSF